MDKQPVQGFSAIADLHDGTYLAMCDNGFGGLENSADFMLRVYRIRPDFESPFGGRGDVRVIDLFELSDPDRRIPFAIVDHSRATAS